MKQEVEELKSKAKEHKAEFEESRMTYFKARALHETITEVDTESKNFVLAHNEFKYSAKWKDRRIKKEGLFIRDCKEDYLMSNEDFKKYMGLCHKERTKRGLNVPSEELCSDYESWKILKEAEDVFIDVALKIVPSRWQKDLQGIKTMYPGREKFLELSLRLDVEG